MKSTSSKLPSQATFHYAVLKHLATCPDGDRRDAIYEAVANLMNLSVAERGERLANLPHLRYRHRTGWSLGVLKKADFVACAQSACWTITNRGRELLTRYPDGFVGKTVFQLHRESDGEVDADDSFLDPSEATTERTPDEQIDEALDQIRRDVAQELLDKIAQAPPVFFEELVLDLLRALGYGMSEEDVERVGRPGDGGIDGVISLDKLGFERVCVQAKRWQGSVGRPEVQGFYGALAGRRAKKGVFITTSGFTREAREFAAHVAETIVLIDGTRLTALMIEHGVGVSHYRILRVPEVDDDYFDAG